MVWVVFVGDYSDRRAVGAFSTEEGARAAAGVWNGDVETFELDALEPLATAVGNGYEKWNGHVSRDGEITWWNDGSIPFEPVLGATLPINSTRLALEVLARDEAEARKIAGDLRAEWLRDPAKRAAWDAAIAAEEKREAERVAREVLEQARRRGFAQLAGFEMWWGRKELAAGGRVDLRQHPQADDLARLRAGLKQAGSVEAIIEILEEAARRFGWRP